MINVRGEDRETKLRELAAVVMENKDNLESLSIEYFCGGVKLTPTFTVVEYEKFKKIEDMLAENRIRQIEMNSEETMSAPPELLDEVLEGIKRWVEKHD